MTDEQTNEAGIPGIQELSTRADEEIDRILNDAARDVQSLAIPELERLAAGEELRVARAAARALGLVRDVAAADALVRIRASSEDRDVRKEAGRSLHKLRSVGVQPTAKAAADEERFVALKPAKRIERALATRYDARGSRFLATAVRPPGGRLFSLAWMLDENVGIKEVNAAPMSKREFGEWVELVREHDEVLDVDTEHARFLVNEAVQTTRKAGGGLPDDYLIYRDAVRGMPEAPRRPIIYEKMSPDEIVQDADALSTSGRLLDLRECRWRLEPERMIPYHERVLAALDSVIVTSEIVREERLAKVVDEVIAAEFTPEVAEKYRRRLEETAYLLLLKGQEKQARSAFAAALALAARKAPRAIPFVVELVERSLGLVAEGTPEARELARREAERERTSLVKPVFRSRTIEGMYDELRDDYAREGLYDYDEDEEEEGEEEDRPLVIDPRDPRQMR